MEAQNCILSKKMNGFNGQCILQSANRNGMESMEDLRCLQDFTFDRLSMPEYLLNETFVTESQEFELSIFLRPTGPGCRWPSKTASVILYAQEFSLPLPTFKVVRSTYTTRH